MTTRTLFERMSDVARQGAVAPITNEDRLPHEKAVWREEIPLQPVGNRPVSVDYGVGDIECTTGEKVDWLQAKRWRFGWPPHS